MKVKNFSYNGFCGSITGGYANYVAIFKEWTKDPGVAVCACSDGNDRLIPTFALEGFDLKAYPEQSHEDMCYFGTPSKS